MTTATTAPLLSYADVDFDGQLNWQLVYNFHRTPTPFEFMGRSNQLVRLPQTSQGG